MRKFLEGIVQILRGKQLTAEMHVNPIPVYVTASPFFDPRAQDGKIYLSWKLLQSIDSEDALAAVLAHEIAHLDLNHSAVDARAAWFGPMGNLGLLLASGTPLGALTLSFAGRYADRVVVAGWSREQELEADTAGFKALIDANFNPAGIFQMLDLMRGASGAVRPKNFVERRFGPSGSTEYIVGAGFGKNEIAHPSADTRAERLRALWQKLRPKNPGTPINQDQWAAFKSQPDNMLIFDALEAAELVLGRPGDPEAKKSIAKVERSPIAKDWVGYLAMLSATPTSTWNSLNLPPIEHRFLADDAPLAGAAVLLEAAIRERNGALAAKVSDAIENKYEVPPALINRLSAANKLRAFQVREALAGRYGSRPSAVESLSLLQESVARDAAALRFQLRCIALSREPNQLLHCGRD